MKPAALITVMEACAILRVSRRTLDDYMKKHPHCRMKFGARVLFTERQIADLIEGMRPCCVFIPRRP